MPAPGVDARRWSDAVSQTLIARRVVAGLRIPEAEGYLADLGKGRVAAVGGRARRGGPEGGRPRPGRRGPSGWGPRQLWHYRRSLNALATLPEPPGR